MFFPAIFCICFMFSQQLTLLVFLLSNQSSLFCSVLPYWSQGSIFDYYSSLEGDHLVINSMTCLFPVVSAFPVTSSTEQVGFLPNNDKGFCVIMFLSFILSFVFFTHSYSSSKRYDNSVVMSVNSGGILRSLISGPVTHGLWPDAGHLTSQCLASHGW